MRVCKLSALNLPTVCPQEFFAHRLSLHLFYGLIIAHFVEFCKFFNQTCTANGKYGPHYHPNNPKFSHWHYYYLWLLLFGDDEERGDDNSAGYSGGGGGGYSEGSSSGGAANVTFATQESIAAIIDKYDD